MAPWLLALQLATAAPLPAQPTDPYQARVVELEAHVLKSEAEILKLQIELASCQATVQDREHKIESLQYSERVVKLVERYKAMFGGEWVWDSLVNAVVPKKKDSPTQEPKQ